MTATIAPRQVPPAVASLLALAAPTQELHQFVGNAITTYLDRITRATAEKLLAHGLRPVVSLMAAESALARVAGMEFGPGFVHVAVGDDGEAALLVLRAVVFYARRFADMDLDGVSDEVGECALQVKAAAGVLALALTHISIEE